LNPGTLIKRMVSERVLAFVSAAVIYGGLRAPRRDYPSVAPGSLGGGRRTGVCRG
jgi:hypothetical protein